jgi:hypothetical protein
MTMLTFGSGSWRNAYDNVWLESARRREGRARVLGRSRCHGRQVQTVCGVRQSAVVADERRQLRYG